MFSEKTYNEIKEVISDYIKQHGEISSSKLAKLIIGDGALELNETSLRKYIDHYKKQPIEFKEPELKLPKTFYDEAKPFKLFGERKILIINDLHIPFHDIDALTVTLLYAKSDQIDTIILNGDIWDAYSLSKYERDPNYRDVWREIEKVIEFLKALRDYFPHAEIIYKFGNHEQRYYTFLQQRAPELWNDPGNRLERKLQLGRFNIKHVENRDFIKAGKLFVLHGDEFLGSGGINVARLTRLKANDNVIFGHFHKTQEDIARSLSDKVIGAWSVGCLCGLRPFYMPINLWTHGFAIVELSKNGDFTVENKKIIRGVIR